MAETVNPLKTRMSWEEFLAAGEDWQRWELVDGEVEYMSPAGGRHGVIGPNLITELKLYCRRHREWVCIGAETAFTMTSGNWRCPDAALVRAERFPARQVPPGPIPFPPDVAFEVPSPGDTARRIARKRSEYQESGVIQVWIDADRATAEVAYPDRAPEYFDSGRPLTIEGVAGFALDLNLLFEV